MGSYCSSSTGERSQMDALIEELAGRLASYVDERELVRDDDRALEGRVESLYSVVQGNNDIMTMLVNLSPVSRGQQSGVREALRLLRTEAADRFAAAEQRLTLASAC